MKKLSFLKKLTLNFGIGKFNSLNILKQIGVNTSKIVLRLKNHQNNLVTKTFKNIRIGKKLKDKHKENLKFLSKINSYKGIRHKLKYPVRGQRTHTNAKTCKKFKI